MRADLPFRIHRIHVAPWFQTEVNKSRLFISSWGPLILSGEMKTAAGCLQSTILFLAIHFKMKTFQKLSIENWHLMALNINYFMHQIKSSQNEEGSWIVNIFPDSNYHTSKKIIIKILKTLYIKNNFLPGLPTVSPQDFTKCFSYFHRGALLCPDIVPAEKVTFSATVKFNYHVLNSSTHLHLHPPLFFPCSGGGFLGKDHTWQRLHGSPIEGEIHSFFPMQMYSTLLQKLSGLDWTRVHNESIN